jgi:hypothetical protein
MSIPAAWPQILNFFGTPIQSVGYLGHKTIDVRSLHGARKL